MAGGGGAWKVAYADFVTAMMAFFMVMWITAQSKQLKLAVAHYFNDPFNSLSKTKGPESAGSVTTGPMAPGSRELLPSHQPGDPAGLKKTKNPKPPGVKITSPGTKAWAGEGKKNAGLGQQTVYHLHDGNRESQGTVITFPESSSALTDAAIQQLNVLIAEASGHRQKIEIRGHARLLPAKNQPGSEQSANEQSGESEAWALSYARCLATMKQLEKAGIEPDRFRLSLAGPYEPRTIRDGPENRTQNSCVEIFVLSEMAEDFTGSREERAAVFGTP
jgi:chemotaxis protein MotB